MTGFPIGSRDCEAGDYGLKIEGMTVHNYRNIADLEFTPCPGINVIYGNNAQGKTNLMEAIWLFTGNLSFRGAKTGELLRFGERQATLSLRFSDRDREQDALLSFGEKKKISLNHVALKTAGELNGNFFAVVFSPSHLSFIQDGPKFRRRFLDIAISEIRPQYKYYLNLYEKLIDQRNALLRSASSYPNLEEDIDVWDLPLAKAGTILSIYRGDYIRKISPLAKRIYDGLSCEKERFSVAYQSLVFDDINAVTAYDEASVSAYYKKLKESYLSDLRQGFTGVGIHRDDLDVKINDTPVRIYGSQGQQRSCVIALKLSEAMLLKKATGENPVMILDDVMSELDVSRQNYILNHLKEMQVFITCCDISDTVKLQTGRMMKMENGAFTGISDIGKE